MSIQLCIIFLILPFDKFFLSKISAIETFQNQKISDILTKLSLQEKEYLNNFFKFEFFVGSFGYTLLGEKPMSIDIINLNLETRNTDGFDYMDLEHILGRYRLKEGWYVWKKYAYEILQNKCTLIDYACPYDSSCREVALINHSNFLKEVEKNLVDFCSILGKNLSSQEILKEYLKGEGNVFNTIRTHDGLFGTLLGYGRGNSWEYMNRGGGFSLEPFFSLELFLKQGKQDTQHVLLPLFAVIPDSKETIRLRESYKEQRKKVNTLYQSEDFLEKVLSSFGETD